MKLDPSAAPRPEFVADGGDHMARTVIRGAPGGKGGASFAEGVGRGTESGLESDSNAWPLSRA